MPWISAERWEEPERTLGWQIADWAEAYLRVPGGAAYGQPLTLSGWQLRALADWYAIGPDRRWLFRRGQIRMAKGTGKSPWAAVVALAELCGPVVYDGTDANGEPVGRARPAPWVQIAAVSEDQAANTYSALHAMLADSALLDLVGIDLGVSRTVLRGRPGRIEIVTASAGSREGQPITAALLDEALALDTPIPTPTGWVAMGDIRVGDLLLGADGLPCEVLKLTDIANDRECYRVAFADGTSLVASAGHLWQSKVDGRVKVRTTAELVGSRRNVLIPLPTPVKLPEADLPLDPYVLGVWLGDGYTGQGYICGHGDDLPEIVEHLRNAGVWVGDMTPASGSTESTFRVAIRRDPTLCPYGHAGPWRVSRNASGGPHRHCLACKGGRAGEPALSPRDALKRMGVLSNKHVPAVYLRASIDQRVALLQGLMDTDGHVTVDGHCTFVNTNEALVAGVVELLRSLGIRASVSWREDDRSESFKAVGKVHFTARNGVVPFRLRRKVERVKFTDRSWMAIRSVERVDTVPVRCVAVDSPDHLFLAGEGWTVTHNTHLWTRTNGGRRLHATMLRNASKMGARVLATTNAWVPGDESVAEQVEAAAAQAPGIMVYGPQYEARVEDPTDVEALRTGLGRTYRDAPWVDVERIVVDCGDPDMTVEDISRFHLNRPAASESVLCSDPVLSDLPLNPGTPIAVGFDGSRRLDSTAVVVVDMLSGVAHLAGIWERPRGLPNRSTWEVPRGEVSTLVDQLFARYRVVRMKVDPSHWQDELAGWQQQHTRDVVDRMPVWQTSIVDRAVEATQTALSAGALMLSSRPESTVLVAHVQRAQVVRRQVGARTIRNLSKPDDGQKIDAAAALTYGYQARLEALAKGWEMTDDVPAPEPFVMVG